MGSPDLDPEWLFRIRIWIRTSHPGPAVTVFVGNIGTPPPPPPMTKTKMLSLYWPGRAARSGGDVICGQYRETLPPPWLKCCPFIGQDVPPGPPVAVFVGNIGKLSPSWLKYCPIIGQDVPPGPAVTVFVGNIGKLSPHD
jgi:hypothetical protein